MRWSPEMGRRLDELRRRKGIKQDELAERSGTPRATLQRILGGRAVPEDERYQAMLEVLGITDADVRNDESDVVNVPIYDIEVAAGAGRELVKEAAVGSWPFPRAWVSQFGADADLAIVTVVGDSQEPELRSGDALMINLAKRGSADGMYVVRLDDALLVKRLQSDTDAIRLRSYNSQYQDVVVPKDETADRFAIIGRAVWAGKLL